MSDKIARGGGPENTAYDKRRHEEMRLKPIGRFFGNTFIGLKALTENPLCIVCIREINTPHIIINGRHYHETCYNSLH